MATATLSRRVAGAGAETSTTIVLDRAGAAQPASVTRKPTSSAERSPNPKASPGGYSTLGGDRRLHFSAALARSRGHAVTLRTGAISCQRARVDAPSLEALQAMLKHRPVDLLQHVEAHLDLEAGRDANDVGVERSVVKLACARGRRSTACLPSVAPCERGCRSLAVPRVQAGICIRL